MKRNITLLSYISICCCHGSRAENTDVLIASLTNRLTAIAPHSNMIRSWREHRMQRASVAIVPCFYCGHTVLHSFNFSPRATGAGLSTPESRNKVSPRICTAHMETAIYTRLPAGLRVHSALADVPRRCYLVVRVRYVVLPSWYTVCMLCNAVAVIVESDSA